MHKTCMMVDVSNLVARAFYGTGKDATPNLGLGRYNLNKMIKSLLEEVSPYRPIAALDLGVSFRKEIDPMYKAQRSEKPEDLKLLLKEAPTIFAGHGFEVYAAEGWEADDVMAHICNVLAPEGWRTLMVTQDRDMWQMVYGEGVPGAPGNYVYSYQKGSYSLISVSEVRGRMGVPPHRVALYKALAGDASDNIKGVPKIGEKGAIRLASEYGSVKKIYDNLDRIANPEKKHLVNFGLENALRMERLCKLDIHCPAERIL